MYEYVFICNKEVTVHQVMVNELILWLTVTCPGFFCDLESDYAESNTEATATGQ